MSSVIAASKRGDGKPGMMADQQIRTTLAALRLVFGDQSARDFSTRLWDGTIVPASFNPRFTLCVNHPGALRYAFRPPLDLNTGRAFVAGLLNCEGDLESLIDELFQRVRDLSKSALFRLMLLLLRLPPVRADAMRESELRGKQHSLQRDREAIRFHYDQPIEFFRTFLDQEMLYSCAYFETAAHSLDDAQRAKVDYTLRKLRLQPGETLLDIGCGWGALVIRAAQKFGANAVGITLSRKQYNEATRRIQALGLSERARVELCDYREIIGQSFDKVVSVGMFEHVGRSKLPLYFEQAFALLKPGGLFLNHGIADQGPGHKGGKSTGFMQNFIFPDGELVAISDALRIAETAGFEVRDVENLREHYTHTLRHWVENIETKKDEAIAQAGEQSYRAWRLYMAGSAQGFRIGRIGVFQTLLAKPDAVGAVRIPMTRHDLYPS